jgi:acyl-CoA synthetase (AMP-forming)/AMP-acid ligase II
MQYTWDGCQLAHFKVPRDYVTVDSLPLTGSGKVDRAAVVKGDSDATTMDHLQS